MSETPQPPHLRDLPLWRLLVALADAERALGPTDHLTRRLADAVQERLTEGARDPQAHEEREQTDQREVTS
jgi:hypothetical protein